MTAAKKATTPEEPAGGRRPVVDGFGEPVSQYQQDLPHPGAPAWKAKPITVLPLWTPAIGDSVIGELSGRQEGYWGSIADGETIMLRLAPYVDQPVRVRGREAVESLRAIKPAFGTVLCFSRLPDRPRWKKRPRDTEEPPTTAVFAVELVEPQGDAA